MVDCQNKQKTVSLLPAYFQFVSAVAAFYSQSIVDEFSSEICFFEEHQLTLLTETRY